MKIFLLLILWSFSALAWQQNFEKEIKQIDEEFSGDIGFVIKNLNDGKILSYNSDQRWYLSSTVKVFVAISLMEEIERGKIKFDQKIKLEEKHFVDGAGRVIWSEPGTVFTVSELLEAMIRESDNSAADMLIGLIGTEELNRDIKKWMPDSGQFTSLLDVRYHAYSELHPKARTLTNMDFIQFKNSPVPERHQKFASKIKVPLINLKASSLEEAYEKYYLKGYNSGNLNQFVSVLEKLRNGKLLSQKNTDIILTHMENMKTGDTRIKSGLPANFKFQQKTGTQIHRACNVGIINSELVVAACIKKPSEDVDSDAVFKKIGEMIGRTQKS